MSMFSAISPAWDIDILRPYFERTRRMLADLSYSHLTICLTNEILSLDSAVSAFTFAVFLDWRNSICQKLSNTVNRDIFIPLFDADRETYITRTDIYRDDFDFKVRVCHMPTDVILINHYILADHYQYMSCFVKEIISHRPYFLAQKLPDQALPRCFVACGACATVITIKCQGLTREIFKAAWDFFCMHRVIVDMLHTAIIDQTENLMVKFTSLRDEKTIDFLETLLEYRDLETFRKTKYNMLAEARRELANVTAMQMLKRDTRVYFNILVSALPILVKEFLRKPDAPIAVQGILRKKHCNYALLLGSDKPYGCITEKDIAVYHKNRDKSQTLGMYLERWATPCFGLIPKTLCCHPCFNYYKQHNLDAIRKDYLVVLKEFTYAVVSDVPQDLTTCIFPKSVDEQHKCPPGFHVKSVLRSLDDGEDDDDKNASSSRQCPPGYHWESVHL